MSWGICLVPTLTKLRVEWVRSQIVKHLVDLGWEAPASADILVSNVRDFSLPICEAWEFDEDSEFCIGLARPRRQLAGIWMHEQVGPGEGLSVEEILSYDECSETVREQFGQRLELLKNRGVVILGEFVQTLTAASQQATQAARASAFVQTLTLAEELDAIVVADEAWSDPMGGALHWTELKQFAREFAIRDPRRNSEGADGEAG